MKKVFMTLVAAASLMFAACGGSTTNNGAATESAASKAAAEEPIWPVDASAQLDKTFDHSNFTMKYPSSLVLDSDWTANTCRLLSADEKVTVTVDHNTNMFMRVEQYAEAWDFPLKAIGYVIQGKPTVKGKKYVFKAVNADDKKSLYGYGVYKNDDEAVIVQFEIADEKAAEFDKYVGAMFNSITFK